MISTGSWYSTGLMERSISAGKAARTNSCPYSVFDITNLAKRGRLIGVVCVDEG